MGYATLPGILPRLKDLFGTGFGQIAFLTAFIFQAARLLPPTHPYLNPANIGKYSIRQAIAQAADNLVFDRRHIDQIVIFCALISGFVLLVLQFFYLIFTLGISPAHAAFTMPFTGMFNTALPTDDIAFQLMDKIFGVPGFFGSAFNNAAPLPFQKAMQGLFAFYSYALLVIAVVVFLYYVFVLVAETAQSGTPFGRRFNHLWAPLRLVVALGLLVPISWGYNSAQYIVLTAAKMGSGFATNGWLLFNTGMENPLGTTSNSSLFARPKVPDSWPLAKFMLLAGTCSEAYKRLGVTDIHPYLFKSGTPAEQVTPAYTYSDAVTYYGGRDVVITFGKLEPNSSAFGSITPYCGSVIVYTHTPLSPASPYPPGKGTLIGPWSVQEGYFNIVKYMWAYPAPPAAPTMQTAFAEVMASRTLTNPACNNAVVSSFFGIDCVNGPTPDFFRAFRDAWQVYFEVAVLNAYNQMVAASAGNMALDTRLRSLGWAGAGIWYNRIAEMNGIFSAAVTYTPSPNELPQPLKKLLDEKRKKNQDISAKKIFTIHLADNEPVKLHDSNDQEVMKVLSAAYDKIGGDELMMESKTQNKQNVFENALNYFTGLNGLFTLRENADIHPLAQLVALGKGIVDGAVRSLFTATIFSFGGGLASAIPDNVKGVGGMLDTASSIFVTIATLGLGVGFVLYYVIPFLPFIYFYFAVGAWVKTIFEAMVGVPLWALAHMRIDGNGLPGESAMSGYYMLLEIFLRPILTVFGLIGALIVFSAMVRTLHDIFPLVTSNIAGFDNNPCDAAIAGSCSFSNNTVVSSTNAVVASLLQYKRSVIDEFFFTIIYAVIVYMMATASFKLIDQVPRQILRWMGAGVQVFADSMPDAAEGLKGYVATSGYLITSKLIGQGTSTVRDLGVAAGLATTKNTKSNLGGDSTPPPTLPGR